MRALQSQQQCNLKQMTLGLACVCLLACHAAVYAQPQALEPLPSPLYAVDHDTPISATLGASSVLTKPGPSIAIDQAGLGLTAADDLNGLSFNKALTITSQQPFAMLFGVDRDTVGAVPPDPTFVAVNRPFNVQDQADRNQEAGDLYVSLDTFDLDGLSSTIDPADALANNTLALNQGDTGGVDQDLSPELAPVVPDDAGLPDNANAAAYPPATKTTATVFFTIAQGSPSLSGPACVYVDVDPDVAGQEAIFADASDLGLIDTTPGADDIDALVVFDFDMDNELDVGVDLILFSLERDSPTLALLGASAADVLISYGNGVCSIHSEAMLLGLDATADNIDCLEVYAISVSKSGATNDALDWAVYRVWPGDADVNGILDLTDCKLFRECFSGDGEKADKECLMYDIDYDGDVDCTDLKYFRSVYGEATFGESCYVISVEEFVKALVSEEPMTSEFACYADLNGDDSVDKYDIPLFVASPKTKVLKSFR